MKNPSKRNLKVADLIHREVALIIQSSVNDPRLINVRITTVELSPDCRYTKIYYILPENIDKKETAHALKKAVGFIRCELAARTKLRYTPNIHFHYDDSIARAEHLLSLMKDVKDKSDE